ncbi:ribokinase [Flavobacterium sp. 3-210]
MSKSKIIVVGSSNTDMVLRTERFPKPGETILGGDFYIFQGGKGANQAVAAARAGAAVKFICRVGSDTFGNDAMAHYNQENIDISCIAQDRNAPTGVAVITVNSEGENSIIVASGANALLQSNDVLAGIEKAADSKWIITQLESPIAVVIDLAKYTKINNKHLILNPAPAAILPNEVYDGLFLITPNQTETELLTGIKVTDAISAQKAAEIFKSKGVQNTIITMGSKGAYVYAESFKGLIDSPKVNAVDTTAAGDIFNGALIVALSEDRSWKEAVGFACRAAAISVTRMGAQVSTPFREEIIM